MLQSLKSFLWIGLLAFGLQASWGFALLGPSANGGDAWQTVAIGFNPLQNGGAPPFFLDAVASGPKNIGEGYRRNTAVMYYGFNQNFSGFFGASGEQAVNQAFTILNGVTNVDSYSSNLVEFPLNSESINYQANALDLLDLKSTSLALMTEQLGLADSVRYIWILHNRTGPTPPNICPAGMDYWVTMRNFDIINSPLNQVQYSDYVNAELYTYSIYEDCGAPPPNSPPLADALEISVDPLINNPPVASGFGEDALNLGYFYTGLTRDDVAGLRYLISSNNINTESLAPGSIQVVGTGSGSTNFASEFTLTTSNLTTFTLATTNSPTVLQTLYPGLVISGVVTNFNGTYTYTFANIATNHFFPTTPVQIQIQTIVTNPPAIGSPVGSSGTVATNTTTTTFNTNISSGDFFLIPTNTCGLDVVGIQSTNVTTTTNNLGTAPGGFPSTNIVIVSTNYTLLVAPCVLPTSGGTNGAATGQFEGVERIQFVRVADNNIDPLTGNFIQPITNTYTMTVIPSGGGQPVDETFQRIVTTPDVLFSAQDLAAGPAAMNPAFTVFNRNVTFNQANILPGLAGPGTIDPSSTITYNKVGPVFDNTSPSDLNQLQASEEGFVWGSFDGTTNAPTVYPNGTSIATLEGAALIQISPTTLPTAANGVFYSVTLSAAGGQSPYTWSLASNSPGMPSGLSVSSSGVISGTPTESGTFDFVIQLNDSSSHTVQINYSLVIN